MTNVIDIALPPFSDSKSIFTIKKVVFADRYTNGTFVGAPITPLIRIGAYELRLFIYEGISEQYQLILTNYNGTFIWFSKTERGWYSLTNVLAQKELIDQIVSAPYFLQCLDELICVKQIIPLPQSYIGSSTSSPISERHKSEAFCGNAFIRRYNKWI